MQEGGIVPQVLARVGVNQGALSAALDADIAAEPKVKGGGADDVYFAPNAKKALDQYLLDTGRYPREEQGLNVLRIRPANEPKWDGPYLKKDVPLDPWGKPYVYRFPGTRGDFDLISFGKDGRAGGDGENADVTNW